MTSTSRVRVFIASIVLLSTCIAVNGLSIAFAAPVPSAFENEQEQTATNDATSLNSSIKQSKRSDAISVTVTQTAKRTLHGKTAKSTELKPTAKPWVVFGNGRTPDIFFPNTLYRPSPPANQAIHAVESNSR